MTSVPVTPAPAAEVVVRLVMKMHALLCGALLASACHASQLPAVAVSNATTDDRAVMAALLEGTLREQRDRSIRAGLPARSDPGIATGVLFLVLDSTVPICSFDRWSGNHVLGCFDISSSFWRPLLEASTCDFSPRQAGAMLASRNAHSMAIRGTLGEKVVLVSSDAINSLRDLSELRRQYPHGSNVVIFGLPVYPTADMAIVYYRAFNESLGFACLVRKNNQWFVRERSGTTE